MSRQGIQQIPGGLQILLPRGSGFSPQENGVMNQLANHGQPPYRMDEPPVMIQAAIPAMVSAPV